MGPSRSVAVILNLGGAPLDLPALAGLPRGRLLRAEVAAGEKAVCVAATVEHDCTAAELLADLRSWAAERGWSVTVAPLRGGD